MLIARLRIDHEKDISRLEARVQEAQNQRIEDFRLFEKRKQEMRIESETGMQELRAALEEAEEKLEEIELQRERQQFEHLHASLPGQTSSKPATASRRQTMAKGKADLVDATPAPNRRGSMYTPQVNFNSTPGRKRQTLAQGGNDSKTSSTRDARIAQLQQNVELSKQVAEQLQTTIKSLTKDNKSLQKQVDDFTAQIAELTVQNREMIELKEKLRAGATTSKTKDNEREGLLKRVADLESQLSKSKTELELLKENFKAAKKEVARLESAAVAGDRELKLAKGKSTAAEKEAVKLKNIEKERRQADQARADMEKEYKANLLLLKACQSDLAATISELRELKKASAVKEEELSTRLASLSDEKNSLQEMNITLETKLGGSDSQTKDLYHALKEEKQARREETSTLKKGLADLLHEKDEALERVAQLDTDVKAAEAHIGKLTAKLHNLGSELERTKVRLAEVIEGESKESQENETLRTALATSSDNLDSARQEIQSLASQLDKLNEEREELKKEMIVIETEQERSFHRNEVLQSTVNDLQATEQQLKHTITGLSERLEVLNKHYVDVKEELASANDTKASMSEQIMSLQNDITRIQSEIVRHNIASEATKEKIAGLQLHNGELLDSLGAAQRQNELTSQELTDLKTLYTRECKRFEAIEELSSVKAEALAAKHSESLVALSELENEKLTMQRSLASLQLQLSSVSSARDDLVVNIELQQDKFSQTAAKLEETYGEFSSTKRTLQKTEDELADLRILFARESKRFEAATEALQGKSEHMGVKHAEALKTISEFENSIVILERSKEALESQIANIQIEKRDLQASREMLEQTHAALGVKHEDMHRELSQTKLSLQKTVTQLQQNQSELSHLNERTTAEQELLTQQVSAHAAKIATLQGELTQVKRS
jgi:chromosome segregation ATPase